MLWHWMAMDLKSSSRWPYNLLMSFDNPESLDLDGADKLFGIIAARYNRKLVDGLLDRTLKTLEEANVPQENIMIIRVPGSNEIPYLAGMQASSNAFDCIICLGVVIAGETNHHEVIAHCTAAAFQEIGLELEVPVINGIIVANSEEEAQARTIGSINRGKEFAQAALEMAAHKRVCEAVFENLMTDLDEDDDLFERN